MDVRRRNSPVNLVTGFVLDVNRWSRSTYYDLDMRSRDSAVSILRVYGLEVRSCSNEICVATGYGLGLKGRSIAVSYAPGCGLDVRK
jgi:hypothetical protein